MVAVLAPGIATFLRGAAAESGAAISARLLTLAGEAVTEGETPPDKIMVPVSSEPIQAIGYDRAGIIIVEFKRGGSRTYEYPGDEDLFTAFLMASSKGEFFNDHFLDRGPTYVVGKNTKVKPIGKNTLAVTFGRRR